MLSNGAREAIDDNAGRAPRLNGIQVVGGSTPLSFTS
jgi:hypothetical protein